MEDECSIKILKLVGELLEHFISMLVLSETILLAFWFVRSELLFDVF